MNKCALCQKDLADHEEKKDNVSIQGYKCKGCGETFFSSNELLKWEILSGKRKENIRKIRKIGNSLVITLPSVFVKDDDIHDNDIAIFKKKKDGYFIQILHA